TTTTLATTTTSSTSTTTTTTIPVRPPSEVRVAVLNSIGLTGAAGRLTEELANDGYQTLEADDFEPEQDPSRIWYREGFAAEANGLLVYVPSALVEMLPIPELSEGADVIIVLGVGYEE
ncbi:MAG: LytR C-terminal domain-containing protein, partial [Acidimicrobiia bacterium]|nr:LytR C-terminal domain-containing protein [Acidimicrobiia bacterium]